MDLFQTEQNGALPADSAKPLAERMRPDRLDFFVGQEHLTGKEGVIRKQIERESAGSMVFWGPPGCGKTTLARIIAQASDADFYQISAVTAGVKDVKKVIETARFNLRTGKKTLLFIDEIHRFNKAQQDVLLQTVEEGVVTLIGATTENPSFEVISPLLSRCRVYKLAPLSIEDLGSLLERSLETDPAIRELNPELSNEAKESCIHLSGGDARILLNALEAALNLVEPDKEGVRKLSKEIIEQVMQKKSLLYDKQGEYHYDIISAFIKSVRGSDPDAAAYWMIRMLDSGEDPKFIARRMIILASEDIGNADPSALPLATSAFTAIDYIGMPEAAYVLMNCAIYLASTTKSNSAATTLQAVRKAIKENPEASVPLHLRNAPTAYMASEGYGKDYKYPPNYPGSFADQAYLPEAMKDVIFYDPTENGIEKRIKDRLEELWPEKRKK